MEPISFRHHRFPAVVIRHAVWLYVRLSLRLRDVEDLVAARSVDVSDETIRGWTIRFGRNHPRSDLQHSQHPALTDQQTGISPLPRPSRSHLAGIGLLASCVVFFAGKR